MRRDLIALPDNSKVWIYQCKDPVSYEVGEMIRKDLYDFSMQWGSHGVELDCYGNLFHYQFLVMVADPSNLPSGCSIDSSVHFVQDLGQKYSRDFMDRMTYAYMQEDHVKTITHQDLPAAYAAGQINDETLFFNNLVNNKSTFLEEWIVPFKESWHRKFV